MTQSEFESLIEDLLGGTPPRVWSLLVTIFGDLAPLPDARLSGLCVNALTAAIGIKPEATRVALHRLRKEGWIDSLRSGRETRYGLTDMGRSETVKASPRVYGTTPDRREAYLVISDPSGSSDAAPNGAEVQILSHIRIAARPSTSATAWSLPVDAENPAPQWVADRVCPPEMQLASRQLARKFDTLSVALTDTTEIPLLHATALRVLVVHEWRRLILRVPDLPGHCFSDGWRGDDCRTALAALLQALPRPDLSSLEAHIDDRP